MLSLQLNAAVDWSIYSTADQIHKRIQTVAAANTGEAILKAHKQAAAAAAASAAASTDDAAAAAVSAESLPALDWLHLRWAPSSDAPNEPTDIQVLRATNPHVNDRSPMQLRLGSSPAARLLTLWLQPTAAAATDAAASSAAASSFSSPPPPSAVSRSALDPLRVLLNFGEHGREIISSEIALRLVGMLDIAGGEAAATAASAAASGSTSAASAAAVSAPPEISPLFVSWLLSHVDLTIVPLLNVWSHRRIEAGHLCERKNAHGVDLNRNWDYLWNRGGRGGTTDRNDDQYPGPTAFSEPESRVLRDLSHSVRPELYINYHSGVREMYCGWDHRSELIPNAGEVLKLLRFVSNRGYCRDCPIGGAGAIGGYVVYGGSMDYIYDTLRAPYSVTVEVFGGARGVRPSDCIAYFNPLSAQALSETTAEWARMSVESMAFLVREKKGVNFPYAIDAWMKPAAAAAASAEDASNHYSTFRELTRSLDAFPALRRLKLGYSGAAPLQRTSWNDACTPFLPALAPLSSFVAAARLPIWSTAFAAGSTSSSSELRVLFVAGAVWNDLLSTQLLCSWLAASGLSLSDAAAASSSLKIFVVPSLFSSFRQRILEVPSMHPGFCSASLSADSKVQILATQLSATETLLQSMRDRIRPQIVVHLSSERFVPRAGVLGSPHAATAPSFQHMEASSLVAGDSEAEGRMLHRMHAQLQEVTSTSPEHVAAGVSWTLRSHAEALAALHDSSSGSDALRCEIGAIDVQRLLITARQQPQQCPSCRLLLTIYLHGLQPPSSRSISISDNIAAEKAESSWTSRERAELQSRSTSDRVPPEEYRRARSSASAFEVQAAAATEGSKRSVSMIGERPSSASSASSAAASSSWCDFLPRNLAAHTPEAVLGLHVAHSNQVLSTVLLRGLLQPLALSAGREDSLWNPRPPAASTQQLIHPSDSLAHALDPSKLSDDAASAASAAAAAAASAASALAFVPPPFIGIVAADLPPSLRSPSDADGDDASAAASTVELLSEPSLRADPSDISAAASEAAAVLAGRGSSVSTQSYTRILDRSRRVGLSLDGEGFSASQSLTVMLVGMLILMAIVAWVTAKARRRQQQKAAEANSRRVPV